MDARPRPFLPPEPPTAPTARYAVRISDPGEAAAALPHLLGFRPHESVVLVGLSGRAGGRVGLCVRADLPVPPVAAAVAARLAEAVASSGAPAVLLAVVSQAADVPAGDDAHPAGPEPPAPDLPHRDLVHALVLALHGAGIAIRDALLVRDERWWSYDCPHPCCAPGCGTPLPRGTTALEAASVAAGQVLAADRDELVARIAPPDGAAAAAMARTATEVGRALTARGARSGRAALAEESWAAVLAGLAAARPGTGRRLADEEVARIAWGLRDPQVRDRALQLALGADAAGAEALWAECTRRAPQPLDAAPATLLAVGAWLRGDGATANVAIARARDSDPAYRLARLLEEALEACLPPDALRAVLDDAEGWW
jgi:Domain of unknown function (DUF4192)